MRKRIAIVLIFLSLWSFAGRSFAEDAAPTKMDFYEAVSYSLKHNNNIRALKKNLSASERDIGIERSELMPKIRFNENFTSTNNPTDALAYKLNQARATAEDLSVETLNHPNSVPNFLTSGTLEQPLYNRKAAIAIKMAKKEYSANGYFYLRKQEDLVHQVALAYLTIITDQEFVKVAEQLIADAKEHLKIAESFSNATAVHSSDILRAKTEIEEAEQKLVSTQRNLKVAKRKLGLLLGIEDAVEISNPLPEIKLQEIGYYNDFAIYRSDVKATEIRVENAKNSIQHEQAAWYPTLNALASYNLYNSNFPFGAQGQNYFAAAIFRWDIFDGNKRKYEILKAKDREEEAREYLEGLRKSVNFRVYEVYQSVEEYQKNLELALETRKFAQEDRQIVIARWQKSLASFVEVTDAQANLNRARINVVKSQNDLESALITLTFESGIIAQELAIK